MNNLFSISRRGDESSGIIWSQDQIAFIVEEYNKNHSVPTIARMFNVSGDSIRLVLRKQGVKILSLRELKTLEFPRNSSYFRKIDTPEKAYWLGFLYADGYISKKNEIRLNLKKDDESQCQKFYQAIGAKNHTVKYSEKRDGEKVYKQVYCHIRDGEMVEDLAKLGCVNKKSLTLTFPTEEQVPAHLLGHFVRGYFDGDGSIHYTLPKGRKTPNYRISFLGTFDVLNKIREFLGVPHLALQDKKTHYLLQINGNRQLERVLALIYKDSNENIELERKRMIYNNFLLLRSGDEPISVGCE